MRLTLLAALMAAPAALLAADDIRGTPPTPTETTTTCDEGTLHDAASGTCVPIEESALEPDALFAAAREMAHAGRFADARTALAMMPDPAEGRVRTYMGFVARKSGDLAGAEAHYRAALAADPDDLLARSYLGQGYAEAGRLDAARAELSEIRARGGRGTWPEIALRLAIGSGTGPAY